MKVLILLLLLIGYAHAGNPVILHLIWEPQAVYERYEVVINDGYGTWTVKTTSKNTDIDAVEGLTYQITIYGIDDVGVVTKMAEYQIKY